MNKQRNAQSLSQAQVEHYRERGILHPLRALPAAEADMHPHAKSRHGVIIENKMKVLYAGSTARGKLGRG